MILKQKYNRSDFLEFQKQFLPDFKKDIRRVNSNTLVTKDIFLLGQSDLLELQIFEFTHTSSSDARVLLAADGFKVMKDSATYRALAVYQSEKSDDWRLSLMTATPEINEKGKIKQSFSNPRRYSFFLGPEAKLHTPEEFLIKKGRVKDAQDLISRFDVEIVTKEFFARYKKLFDDLEGFLSKDHAFKTFASKNDIDIDSFAKKILGQIVFCYFLQKKGWLGAQKGEDINMGDKDFMRTIFNKFAGDGKNFYNNSLEYLFYDSLNRAPDKKGDFYRDYLGFQVPFLNGGLFEPLDNYDWKKSFLHIPDRIFSNNEGTGVLDVFDLYNFTVYEDDSVDREVSVDPEMLGKVFENLLPENLRKGQGAYYTPREIVHYMCQESLINYLVTETGIDEKNIRKLITSKAHLFTNEGVFTFSPSETEKIDKCLAEIKICDPACGSGAFLVGMLHEIVMARRVLNPKKHEYRLKKEAIQNAIYGVDIDSGAVEIAKLRLWLSLVVDYELEDIEPLPNLDYKIMCGNSLLEELIVGDESIKLFDEKLLYAGKKKTKTGLFDENGMAGQKGSIKEEQLQKLLKEKQKKMLDLSNQGKLTPEIKKNLDKEMAEILKELAPKKKKKTEDYSLGLFADKAEVYFTQLRDLHKQYFEEYDSPTKKLIRGQIEQIEIEFIKSSIKEKMDSIEMRIKNLNLSIPGDRKKMAELMRQKLEYSAIPEMVQSSKAKPYFLWKLNFFEVFQEKSGFDIVIANPPFVDSEMMTRVDKKSRDIYVPLFESAKGNWDLFVIFIEKGVQLLKESGLITYIVPNKMIAAKYSETLRTLLASKNVKVLRDYSRVSVFHDVDVYPIVFLVQKNDHRRDVNMTTMRSVNEVMEQKDIPSKIFYEDIHWDRYFTANEVLNIILKMSKFLPISHYFYDISSASTVNEAYELKKILKEGIKIKGNNVKKLINTGTIDKYVSLWGRVQTQYIKNRYSMPIVLDNDLRRLSVNRYNQSKATKIILAGMSKDLECFYDEGEFVAGKSTVIILENDENKLELKSILSILNSKLASFWFSNYFKSLAMAGGYITVSHTLIGKIPIAPVSPEQEKQLILVVNKIFALTKADDYLSDEDKQKKVDEYIDQIDQMIYKLYGITDDEIKIVEGQSPLLLNSESVKRS